MARRRSMRTAVHLPPTLVRLIHAAERRSRERGDGLEAPGLGRALAEFGALALWALPVHGVFVPNNNDVCLDIERAANAYLNFDEARRSFRDAAAVLGSAEHRQEIESAHNLTQSISDEAYFYAGLAFGLTLANFAGRQ